MYAKTRPQSFQRGFSLVELMVGTVISLLVALAALGSTQFFMVSQRQSAGMGTVESSATSAIASVKQEASMAGLGLLGQGGSQCLTMNLSVDDKPILDGVYLPPVSIVDTDKETSLTVAYATSMEAATGVPLLNAMAAIVGPAETTSFVPTTVGQSVMLSPAESTSQPCTVRSVTKVTAPAGTKRQLLEFAATGKHNKVAFTTDTPYPYNSNVIPLGALTLSKFELKDGALVMTRPLVSNSELILTENVVAFIAQYGVSDGLSPGIKTWEYAKDAWASVTSASAPNIQAIRVGIVVRSTAKEKADKSGTCAVTTEQPELFGKTLELSGDWQCYRYRVITGVTPLRNVLLGASA
ncbi:PilW family protein [Nostoc sp. CHAB 5834]|nr:PilW family protein [Nostoc sp. CHAB 5834]